MILDHYLDENKKVYGDSVNFKQDVSLERCFRRSDMEFSEVEQGQKKLQKATELEMEAAVIVIDGEDTVAVKDESTATEVWEKPVKKTKPLRIMLKFFPKDSAKR